MANIDEIEQLYYKAMKDARLDQPAAGNPGPPGYSTEDFLRWARKVDIYTLGEGAADFALQQHDEIVQTFGKYRHTVSDKLSKIFTYEGVPLPGQLQDIGSCWHGSKVGTVNEMDSLYVIRGDHFTVKRGDKRGVYRVYLEIDGSLCDVEPRRVRRQFADKYSQLISELETPSCLEHGGYNTRASFTFHGGSCHVVAPDSGSSEEMHCILHGYSGVRYNGPAVTSQFISRNNTLLTWDMTPVIVLPDIDGIYGIARERMESVIEENPDKMFPPGGIHLIPDAVDNLWRLSTAQMEADTLRVLSSVAPMKQALSFCKVLSSRLKRWCKTLADGAISAVEIVEELDRYLTMRLMCDKMEAVEHLNKKMRYAHIWLPSHTREWYHEDDKNSISINNAAVKHIIMRTACKLKGAFAPKENMELVKELIQTVFETLGNDAVYSSEHALLEGIRISHFSVSPSMASQKLEMARDVCCQCRTLHQEAMTGVGHKHATLRALIVSLLEHVRSILVPIEIGNIWL